MTVKQWKRCITLIVIALILILIILVVFFAVKTNSLEQEAELRLVSANETVLPENGFNIEKWKEIFGESEFEYQKKYEKLYIENDFLFRERGEKICYLTFDDGPSEKNTAKILDILKEYDIKATFFVINHKGERVEELYKRIVNEGHTIGVHSYSHEYDEIYDSVDAFLDDFNKMSNKIERITGVKPEIFRFPGGSVNTYNAGIYVELAAEMLRRGYAYYDWNVSSGDASYNIIPAGEIKRNVLKGMYESGESIILFHDADQKTTTVEALPEIIEELLEEGYEFSKLDNDVKPIVFNYLS